MSKQSSAAKVIKFAAARGYTPTQTATLLNELELLAEDLPEPDHDTRDPKWRAEYEEEYGYSAPDVWCKDPWLSVGVFPESQEIRIWDDGEPLKPFSIAEARKLAYCLLAAVEKAAANYSEEE